MRAEMGVDKFSKKKLTASRRSPIRTFHLFGRQLVDSPKRGAKKTLSAGYSRKVVDKFNTFFVVFLSLFGGLNFMTKNAHFHFPPTNTIRFRMSTEMTPSKIAKKTTQKVTKKMLISYY